MLTLLVLIGFAGSIAWVTSQTRQLIETRPGGVLDSSQTQEAKETPKAPNAPGSLGRSGGGGSFTPRPDTGDTQAAQQLAQEVEAIADAYLEAQHDGTIYALVPGGDKVDPGYIGAFIYTLTDLKSASRFGGTAAQLQELLDKAEACEARFLAGEDLDVTVRITRADGSVFASDGIYRLAE